MLDVAHNCLTHLTSLRCQGGAGTLLALPFFLPVPGKETVLRENRDREA